MVNDMVSNNIILELVEKCILDKNKIFNINNTLTQGAFQVSIDMGVDGTLICFHSYSHNIRLALEFNNNYNSNNCSDIVIGNHNTYRFPSLLYTRSSIIIIDDEKDNFNTSEEAMFKYSLTLSLVKFKYYKLVKLFKDNNITNDFYMYMMKDCEMTDSDFREFFVLYKRLIG